MKVLFVTRPTVFSGPGGDTVQLLKTKAKLEDLGVFIDISETIDPDMSKYDLIHFFNLRNPQDLLVGVRKAKRLGIPTALSTIWGSYNECDKKSRSGIQKWMANNVSEYTLEYFKTAARIIVNGNFHYNMFSYLFTGHYRAQREIAESVDVLLPNSPTEMQRVVDDMRLPNPLGVWVANAVDTETFNSQRDFSGKYSHLKDCILCAARIEIRKCQLDLIKAMKGLPYTLVLVGKPSPNSKKYFEACQNEAGDNVVFIDHVTQDELAELYFYAKAHALISWMETPGLSSLEAAVMGCNILVTDRGDTRFYFDDYAEYCEPGDVESIREGVVSVMSKTNTPDLKNKILSNFTWQHTAKQTLEGYQLVTKEGNK